jgi:hypothetical protein
VYDRLGRYPYAEKIKDGSLTWTVDTTLIFGKATLCDLGDQYERDYEIIEGEKQWGFLMIDDSLYEGCFVGASPVKPYRKIDKNGVVTHNLVLPGNLL